VNGTLMFQSCTNMLKMHGTIEARNEAGMFELVELLSSRTWIGSSTA
jgi:hypothetical protein